MEALSFFFSGLKFYQLQLWELFRYVSLPCVNLCRAHMLNAPHNSSLHSLLIHGTMKKTLTTFAISYLLFLSANAHHQKKKTQRSRNVQQRLFWYNNTCAEMFRKYYDTYIILYSTRETFVLCLVQFDKKSIMLSPVFSGSLGFSLIC